MANTLVTAMQISRSPAGRCRSRTVVFAAKRTKMAKAPFSKERIMVKETARVFVQTAKTDLPSLDRWVQVGEEEAKLAYDMVMRNELSGGTGVVREFEASWREFTGLNYAMTINNGTSAIFAALFGLGVGPGDEVICPTFTWIGSISPAPFLGARPVFCESDPETLLIDPGDVRKKITPKTKAIIAVHLWGNVCDMDALMDVSRETGIPVIEDCAHSHGATYKGKITGSIADAGAWSLQGSKAVSGGEAGVIATNNPGVFDRACLVGQVNRMVGMDLMTDSYERYQPLGTGMKFRAHPIAIGIASIQLKKLGKLNKGRGKWIESIENGIADISFLRRVKVYDGAQRGGFYGFPVHFVPEKCKVDVREFIQALREEGVTASPCGYPLLHTLPYFAEGFDLFTRNRGPLIENYPGYKLGDFPITEKAVSNLIFMPLLTDPIEGADEWILDRIHKVAERLGD